MSETRVAVVIPTFNQADYLRECIASVIGQSAGDWQMIVVNNFSDDHTESVVAEFDDPRIRLLNFHNNGIIAASRNLGAAKTQAPWIAFLDSDDTWHPDKLARCLEVAVGETDVIGHGLRMMQDGEMRRLHPSGPEARASFRRMLFEGGCLTPSASLIRREVFNRAGGFCEAPEMRTAEDYDLWLRLAFTRARFAFLDDFLTDYRLHDTNASKSITAHMDATLRIVDHHYRNLERPSVLDALRRRRRRAFVYHGAARNSLRAGKRAEAMCFSWASLKAYPCLPRAYANLALALMKRVTP
jgi:teichuronic acid biosynthesis glycosyltransferase TuaG